MSTYTDLHNKVKESLNVDYHSRETNQKSLFLNPENEFWGTFHGEVDVKGASINNGVLSDVTIYKANLICSSLDGVDVTTFGKRLHTLDDYVHGEFTEKIDMEDARLQNEIDAEVTARKNAINLLSSNLSIAVNGKYNAMLSAFDAEVSARIHGDKDSINYTTLTADQLRKEINDEVSTRISVVADETAARLAEDSRLSSVDYDLSCQLIDTNLRLDAESHTRLDEDTKLDLRIDNLDSESYNRYLSALAALDEHAQLNEQQFNELEEFFNDKIEHDKHYEIVETEKIQSVYPYVLKDFAINRLEISAVDGYAYHLYDDRETNVGMLVRKNGSGSVLPLAFFGLQHDDPEVFNALNPNCDFTFVSAGVPQGQGDSSGRNYTIKITDCDELSTSKFILSHDGDIYLPVIFDGRLIGKIHSYDTTPAGGAVVRSGLLTITSLDTDIQPFKHISWRFNADLGETEYVEDEVSIKYNGDNTFSLGLNPVKCQQIKNANDGYLFAKVYDGGIVRNDALVKNVRAKVGTVAIIDRGTDEIVDTPINAYFDLSSSSDYTAEIAPYVYLKCLFNTDYSQYRFEIDEITKHWKYELKLSSDEELSGQTVAYVTVGTPNERIEDNDFSTLSVDFTEELVPGLLPPSFNQLYVLKRDKTVPEKLWKATATNDDGDTIQVTYDCATVNIKMVKNVSEGVTYIKFLVNTDDPAVGVDRSRVAYSSPLEPIDTRSYTEWSYLGNTVAVIDPEREDAADQIILRTKANANDEVICVIPDKLANNKNYSREMLLVVKFMSADPDRKINVKFVDADGNPVKYFYDKHPEIYVDVNRYTTLRITEIGQKKFLITDWNESEIRDKLRFLKQYIEDTAVALSNDYIERIENVSVALSNEISAEIENRISDVAFLSDELSTFEDQTTTDLAFISNEVSTFIRRDAKGMKFFGDVKLSDAYELDEIAATVKDNYTLYGLIKTNAFINISGKELRTGFTFRTAGDADTIFTVKSPDGGVLDLRNNEYLVLNKDISALSDITTSDVNVWKDYDLSVNVLLSTINNVSVDLRAEIDAEAAARISTDELLSNDYTTKISDETSARISSDEALQSQISTNREDIDTLSGDVGVIQETIRGGVNYKGVVNVIDTDNPALGSFSLLCNNFHVSSLFFIDFGTAISSGVDPAEYYDKPNPDYTADTILSNGFMYLVSMTGKNLSDQWYVDGVQIDDKDYIIINCRPSDCKAIKDLTSADIDIIDALDSNVATTQLVDRISTDLSSDYVRKIETAKNDAIRIAVNEYAVPYTNAVSTELSTDYCAKDESVFLSAKNYADDLSNSLSIDYIERIAAERAHTDLISNEISTELGRYESETSGNIDFLSNEISTEIRRDKKGMKFFGDVHLSDTYNVDEIGAVTKEDWSLYGLIKTNDFINVSGKELRAGFTFRATGDASRTFTAKSPDGGVIELHNNDYIVLNKEIPTLSSIKVSDINIWKDYDLSVNNLCAFTLNEVKDLSIALSGDIDDLSARISGDIDSLSTRLSNDIDKLSTDLSGDIDSLSTRLSNDVNSLSTRLSGDVDSLSTRLSGDIDKLSTDLSGEVDSLSTNLSTDVSAFITDHYERTFETDVDITAAVDYKFDMLKMVDEEDPLKKYTMHLSGGTIVLIPMS